MEKQELLERFSKLYNLSIEEASQILSGETEQERAEQLSQYVLARMREKQPMLNRKQRRKLKKRYKVQDAETVTNTAKKLQYISLIEQLRELNNKKENEDEGFSQED